VGQLDLQLQFRVQDTALEQLYEELLRADAFADGVLDSTREETDLVITGKMLDNSVFAGEDDVMLFLVGKSLRDVLNRLFGHS